MNTLSIFLYIAGTVGGLFTFLLMIGGGLMMTGLSIMTYPSNREHDEKPALIERAKRLMIFGCLTLFLAVLVPSKTTMYTMAASEIGEKVLKSPVSQKSIELVEAYLDKELSNTKESVLKNSK
jgi:phosphatidylglycerophosphate synthase